MVCSYERRGCWCLSLMFVAMAFFSPISTIFAQELNQSSPLSAEQVARADISFKVISVEGGYGYDIYVDGKRMIHQAHIPGIAGVAGFRTKEDSQKVAELVIRKLKNKEMPPTITEEELRKLKVID